MPQLVAALSWPQRVVGLIPGQGTYLVAAGSLVPVVVVGGHVGEAANWWMFLSHNNASLSLCQINKPLLGLGFLKNHFIHLYLCTFSPHSHFALGSTNYATFPDHFLPYFLNQNKQASGTFSFLFILIFRKGNTCCFLIMVSLSFSSTSVLLDYITFSIPANIF